MNIKYNYFLSARTYTQDRLIPGCFQFVLKKKSRGLKAVKNSPSSINHLFRTLPYILAFLNQNARQLRQP